MAKIFNCKSLEKELHSADNPEYMYASDLIQNPTIKSFIFLHKVLGNLFSVGIAPG